MTSPVRVLVVDDDALVRAGLTLMLDGVAGIVVVAEAGDGSEVRGVLDAHPVDVVLMDIRMPGTDGISATEQVRARADPPEVVILTTFDADENVLRALRAGAGGFLLKDSPPADLVDAVVTVAAGDPILSPRITRRLMERAATEAGAYERARSALAALTYREHEVALAVGQGKTNAEIAARLRVSVATVKAHMTRVMAKLDVGNRTQIALLMHDAGLC
ncbi:DNA-binding response regulator, NarL/FixJ family, contains REC and HTH domains [Prauserella marina]|uniref:DNA-binding response regulator, NarL/FixJ family, contains REC and HTH domains n=1 Tax=Prauserella marina TaxID=530584 RepID=A0A1G6R3C4_9PSEU|nr:response regulator transcription factor [Prauserella marina]PWV76831.1 LuxR family two component transcriptional regulator [Prauserella marina]SDC98565.1 DNA-binding response regulator, NarL/FixJ family, contains REC and HTH domains [Prauserella marina]